MSRAAMQTRDRARRRIRTKPKTHRPATPAPAPAIFPELAVSSARLVDVSTGAPAHLHASIKVYDRTSSASCTVEILGAGFGFHVATRNVLEFTPTNPAKLRDLGLFLCELATRSEQLVATTT